MASELYVGDTNTTFRVTLSDDGTAVDVSGATTMQIKVKNPSGTLKTWTASFTSDGQDGQIEYATTAASDLDEAGVWAIQARIADASSDWHSSRGAFTVHPVLS
tara:strand:+ start:2392 stop:2703 length:312 start_codon:yes stop_codon:yes gene_type:complete